MTVVSTLDRAVALTHLHLVELERRSDNLGALTVGELQSLTGMISKLQRALGSMATESRKATQAAEDAARSLTYDQKRALIVEFFGVMPPEHQRELAQELMRLLNQSRTA